MTTGDRAQIAQRAATLLDTRLQKPPWKPLPHQVPPPGDWYGWAMIAGRGAGKTDACAEYVVRHVNGPPCIPGPVPHWIGIIAPTLGDAATACVEGPSGIRAHDPSAKGPIAAPGGSVVRWPNGAQAKLFGTDSPGDVERLRAGGNTCLIWAEELAAWRHLDAAWDQMRFGLRSGPRPHWIASTTPKPKPIIKKLVAGEIPNSVLTTATTYDNPHLPEHIRQALEDSYNGTQLGQQELLGLIMDEDENSLWTRAMLDAARVRPDDMPELVRTVVGVDPSGGAGEQGIVVAGKSGLILPGGDLSAEEILRSGQANASPAMTELLIQQAHGAHQRGAVRPQHHGYVLDDRTCHLPPDGWGRRAVQAAIDWEADELVVERNYGGDMAVATLRTAADALGVQIPIRTVTATRGKAVRAQPVSALTAQGRWHHAGVFEELESQMCTWYPEIGWSPDRIDAAVWTAWQLKLVRTAVAGQGSLGGDLARKQITGGRLR
ncbi:terminase family protein [Streptomyces sp. 549]|uniref:terminase large subunit domain-containing protein n=1 Tax=Streptomyces sp. 549 TaxID=3049076 RepID=UPI0024C44C1D|nr:terminase family protein [Streptomyces sp. 549]MDK1473601.1 terminase family protein [Streptomyces sp. 549]